MRIAIIGSGMVGRTLAARLSGLGHEVAIGTRDPKVTLARTGTDDMGTPPYAQWQDKHPKVTLLPFAEAGDFGELVINASNGANTLAALQEVGATNLAGKVLLDVAVPLDFSHGMPPILTVANTDSLGEQVQRAFPDTHVVKTLNTMFCEVMVDPGRVPGPHTLFVAGNDEQAKHVALDVARSFGWADDSIIDLGGIEAARGSEMYMRLYFELVATLDTFDVTIEVHHRPSPRGRTLA